jgi:hypothetical protein
LRNAASMSKRDAPLGHERYFGGRRAMARMTKGAKTALSSARRRLGKLLIRDYEDPESVKHQAGKS